MSSASFKGGSFFGPQYKTKVHIVQLILVVIVMAISGARLLLTGRNNRTRTSSMGLGMGAKSLIFITYQLLTEHVRRFQRWASLKAYFIINTLEIVFWAAVVFLVLQANLKSCLGTSCALGWVVVPLAVFVSILSAYAAVVSYLDYQFFKTEGKHRTPVKYDDHTLMSHPASSFDG